MPTASFAGQQDTYLNVVGPAAILQHISRCWASLFTERAVTYRLRNGFGHRKVHMAVVVQQMVFPEAAGVLFTADPVTGNRKVVSVEAVFGLGEALVSGLVNADAYQVRDGEVVAKAVATKQLAIQPLPAGGTQEQAIDPARQGQPALTDAQIVQLAELGRRIEAHFGRPQDIEWCLVDDGFQIVQSRAITTLFPIPAVDDGENHVYISVGHQQMMTDAMKPLGLSFWQLTTPRPMAEAGGRLFVDVTQILASPASRASLLELMVKSDPLMRDALQTILERDGFIRSHPDEGPAWTPPGGGSTPIEADPAIVTELIEHSQASLAVLKRDIRTKSGSALLDFILEDIQELKRILFDPRSHQVFMGAMEAAWWLNEQLEAWLGEKNVADTLDAVRPPQRHVGDGAGAPGRRGRDPPASRRGGVPAPRRRRGLRGRAGNAAGRAGIARRHPGLPRHVRHALRRRDRHHQAALERTPQHARARDPRQHQALRAGRRRAALRTRAAGGVGEGTRSAGAIADLAGRKRKAEETKRMIDRVRTFIGYREYPKYGMVSRYFVYKQALLEEAERLVQAHVLRESEDIFYLRFEELQDVVRTNTVDDRMIQQRKDAFRSV